MTLAVLSVAARALSTPTPPMGWNPYNCLSSPHANRTGCWPPTEDVLLATARALKASGLHRLGYDRINLDGGWALKERDPKSGRVVPNPQFYPRGLAPIADELEALGFHFGLYSDSGTLQCGGQAPGSLGHEGVDAAAYAEWGVTFLKYDNCFASGCAQFGCGDRPNETVYRYTAMSAALNATRGRHGPILFSMCEWGYADPAVWGPAVANMWRNTADISDEYWAMSELTDLNAQWFDRAGPATGWNDPDLLEVGNGGMTSTEYRAQFSLWCAMKSPLLISTNVLAMSAETRAILGAEELIQINQDALGVQARLVEERPPNPSLLQVWAGPLSRGRVVALFWNRGNATATFLGRFVNMQLFAKAAVRDPWARKDLGTAATQIEATVEGHGVEVRVLTPLPDGGRPILGDAEWRDRWRGWVGAGRR